MESLIGNTRKPDLTFFRNGQINITARIAKCLSLSEGDIVDILKSDRELYFYVKSRNGDIVGQHSGRCRSTRPKKGYRNFRVNCKRLTDAIFRECNGRDVVQLAAGDLIEIDHIGKALPLITRINLYNND